MDPFGEAAPALAQMTGVLLACGGGVAVVVQAFMLISRHPLRSLWLFLASSCFAIALLANGFIFTSLSSVGLTVGWAVSLLMALAALVLSRTTENSRDHTLLTFGAVVGLLATAVTAVQVLNPAQPVFATPGACVDTPVAHSAVTVRTGEAGQNARSGPGVSYPVQRRYDAGCLIGVDAYCIGTPVLDSASQLWDYRWFRPRFSRTYLPAALVFETVGTDIGLGATAAAGCPGGRTDPSFTDKPTLSYGNGGKAVVGTFTPVGSNLVGFASAVGDGKHLRITQLDGRVHHLDAIALPDGKTSPADSPDVALATDTGKLTEADETSDWRGTLFAAVPCIAANVPSYGKALFFPADTKGIGAGDSPARIRLRPTHRPADHRGPPPSRRLRTEPLASGAHRC